jgi:hypothetical protein
MKKYTHIKREGNKYMKKQVIEKISALLSEKYNIEQLLKSNYKEVLITENKEQPEHFDPINWGIYHKIFIDKNYITEGLNFYLEDIKRELIVLGFEEDTE